MLFKTDTLFGHVIEDTDDGPVYQDDGSKVDGDNPRPCLGCKVKIQHGEQDPCIANLPGTLNACCGHGRERTPVSGGLAGYVALRDGRTFRFPGTVGGEAVRAAVDLAIADKELPEGFVFDEEKMWWYGLTDAQVAYVHANTRRAIFADWRVRDALIHAFNFEFINQVINKGRLPRAISYFSNSELDMRPGAATGRVAEFLAPFADSLLPGALAGYAVPKTDGTERNRRNLRIAAAELAKAGWLVAPDGVLRNRAGQAFQFEIMLRPGEEEAIANLFTDALKRLGITPVLTLVDTAQHRARREVYDYDMMVNAWVLSLSPGNEQNLYWNSAGVTQQGTRNYMGMRAPAADKMIERILTSDNRDDFVAATRALDRVLTTGRYVIPFWFDDVSRLAHRRELHFPEHLPVYGDWLGFLPDVWWWQE